MIALHSDCLLFQLKNGESIPCSADMISVEIVGEVNGLLDPEMLRHAAASVFHYFKFELEREAVTIGEFSVALEKVLGHLGYTIHAGDATRAREISETDLGLLARESGDSLELFFFPRLRDELRASGNRPACCVFAACAAASSSSPARAAGAPAANSSRTRLSNTCAAASPPSRSKRVRARRGMKFQWQPT